MKKILIGIFVVHGMLHGMDENNNNNRTDIPITTLALRPKEADFLLWSGIARSNYNEVLHALKDGANQNYIWTYDDANYKEYVGLTAVIYSMKQLRQKNRRKYASTLSLAVVWDVGECIAKSALAALMPQYPMLSYAGPVWNSRTANVFLGQRSERDLEGAVEVYRPEKELVYQLITKEDTDLTVTTQLAKPVTALAYLQSLQQSWNPLTREDGRDLSYQLSLKQLRRSGLDTDQSIMNIPRPFFSTIDGEDPLRESAEFDRRLWLLMRQDGTRRIRGNSIPTFFQ